MKHRVISIVILTFFVIIIIPSVVLIICGNMEESEQIDPKWGIVQSVENVTPTGLTIVWNRDNAENTVDLITDEGYKLERKTLFGWRSVPTIIEEYGVNAIGYLITVHRDGIQEVDWEWLYGELPKGTYRIWKTISLPVGTEVVGMCYTEFEIR